MELMSMQQSWRYVLYMHLHKLITTPALQDHVAYSWVTPMDTGQSKRLLCLSCHLSTPLCCVAITLIVLTVPLQQEGHEIWGWTPLHHAALHNQFEVVKLLLSHGADIDTPDCKVSPAVQLQSCHSCDSYQPDQLQCCVETQVGCCMQLFYPLVWQW